MLPETPSGDRALGARASGEDGHRLSTATLKLGSGTWWRRPWSGRHQPWRVGHYSATRKDPGVPTSLALDLWILTADGGSDPGPTGGRARTFVPVLGEGALMQWPHSSTALLANQFP